MWPGRDVAANAKSVFSTQFSVTLLSFLPNIRDCFLRKKRELATQFSFLCMPSTVSGSNSWSFAIIGDLSLEAWQRSLRMTGDTDASKSSKLFFPSSFFFACFQIFLKKAFPERKIALEIFPKKDEGTLQITVQSMTNATFETVGQVLEGNLRLFDHRLKKMPLPLLSCTSLLYSRSSDGKDCLSLLEKNAKG